uniref:Transmembrane protein n=1 Tax=Phytophthora ramorum TaxID=164328 RepID=H3GPK1_PHYRM
MPSPQQRFAQAWERTQVELHGTYSPDRVLALAKYTRETGWPHIMMVLLVTPLPCLLITVLSDVFPLEEPSEGIKANKMFQVRQYYSYVVMSFLCAQQFRTSVRALPYPNWRVARNTVVVAALTIAVLYGYALWVGFPVPFSIVIAMPAWVVIITVSMAIEWLRLIQQNPGTGTMVINTVKVWLCEVLLVVTYPPYFYVFTTLSKTGQMFFASLLPVIKLIMRNIFTLTVVHLSDEMPEVIVFNSEVFNALFVSYCMQNSPSFGTTLMVTAALLIQLAMSLRDVNDAVRRMEQIGRQLAHEDVYNEPRNATPKSSVGAHVLTCLERAESMILDQQDAPQDQGIKMALTNPRRRPSVKSPDKVADTCEMNGKMVDEDFNFESPPTMRLHGGARIQPAPENAMKARDSKAVTATSLQYILEVRRLLYLTEFLVLINYVGVFIPLVFSIYMAVMFSLPNRLYYAQLAELTKDELYSALQNVMFNCSLKLVALVLLCWLLQHRLRFSAIHQLAFVLEKQWPGVQTKICFWVFYNVQASLQHHGFDYTFKFGWLNEDPTSSMSNSTNT